MANDTMVAASLSTIELNSYNNVIFSAINRIRYILNQHAEINRVLNKIKKVINLKASLENTCRTI